MGIYYVNGLYDKGGDGSRENPFRSFDAALSKAKEGDQIVFQKGEYRIDHSLILQDKEGIILTTEDPRQVCLKGSTALSFSEFTKVTDPKVLSRLRDPIASDKMLQINLKAKGIYDLGELTRYGFHHPDTVCQPELYIGGTRQTLSRYPKKGSLQFDKVLDIGPKRTEEGYDTRGGSFAYSFILSDHWKAEKDVWIDGVLGFDWEHTHNKVKGIDFDKKIITMATGEVSGILQVTEHKQGNPVFQDYFFFENVFCEMSEPGDYYIDRASGILYLIPPENLAADSRIELTSFSDDILKVINCKNITISNINCSLGRGNGIEIKDCEDVIMQNITLYGFGGVGISVEGNHNRISDCEISEIGGVGIHLSGGDEKWLTGGQNEAIGCDIHHIGYRYRSYHGAVRLQGVAHRVRGCRLHDTPHMAITFSGNDHIIEQNEFFHNISEFRDMAAIYNADQAGCHRRGTIIRHNYFHHIGNDGEYKKMGAIYPDWCVMGITIEENIFYRIGTPNTEHSTTIFNNGGSYILTRRNLFIECPKPYHLSLWLNGWGKRCVEPLMEKWRNSFAENDFEKQPHFQKYPELRKFFDEDRVLPDSNTFEDNVFYNSLETLEYPSPYFSKVGYGETERLKCSGNRKAQGVSLDTSGDLSVAQIAKAFSGLAPFAIEQAFSDRVFEKNKNE